MRNCLVVCATSQDAACEVGGQIANALRLRGVAVDLECSSHVSSLDGYDGIVIGARLCHGRWKRSTKRFLKQHRAVLQETDVALFAPGPCAAGQEAYDRSWNRLIKMLQRLGWLDPVRIEVFADNEMLDDLGDCPVSNRSRIAHWCRSLTVSMRTSDRETPHQPGIT